MEVDPSHLRVVRHEAQRGDIDEGDIIISEQLGLQVLKNFSLLHLLLLREGFLLGLDYATPVLEKLVRCLVGKEDAVIELMENLEIVLRGLPIYPIQVQKNIGVKAEGGFIPQPL